MGYCIEFNEGSIKIKKENMPKVIQSLRDYLKSGNELRWVNGDWEEDISVDEIFEDLRYYIEEHDGYYEIIDFEGEKYGDDDILFKLIAPYCEDGYLQFTGEDSSVFRFIIKDGTFEEKYATLNWD